MSEEKTNISLGIRLLNIMFYGQLFVSSFVFCFTLGLCYFAKVIITKKAKRVNIWRDAISAYGAFVIRFACFPFIKVRFIDTAPHEKIYGVMAANHRSASDAYLFGLVGSRVAQIVNDWPFKLPFYGYFARNGGYFDIFNTEWDAFMTAAVRAVKEEETMVVGFPEGTRSGKKELNQFRGALFRVALAAQCPVYPILITGNENIPDRDFVIHPGTITIYKLPSVQYETYKGWTAFKLKNHVRNLLAEEIRKREGLS